MILIGTLLTVDTSILLFRRLLSKRLGLWQPWRLETGRIYWRLLWHAREVLLLAKVHLVLPLAHHLLVFLYLRIQEIALVLVVFLPRFVSRIVISNMLLRKVIVV